MNKQDLIATLVLGVIGGLVGFGSPMVQGMETHVVVGYSAVGAAAGLGIGVLFGGNPFK